MTSALEQRITDRTALVGVIGLGYVGLPLARAFHDAGFRVLGFDVDPAKIESLGRGECYIGSLADDFARDMVSSGRFEPTSDFKRLAEPEAILICVPTPLGDHLEPDLSFVERTAEDIARTLRPGRLVVLESTTYPTTTRDVVLPRLESSGLRLSDGADDGFFLAYSPEREDPGRADRTAANIPKVVGGVNKASGQLAARLYESAVREVVLVSSAEVAESAKLLENIYRAVNIALVNELKVLLDRMGVDVWEVIRAASTKPFGFQPFYPGPGLGGHCIPIDPYYLTWKAREVGLPTRFIELAGEVNRAMPDHVVSKLERALNDRGRAIRGSRILVLGLAYKKNVDDVRESPSLVIIERLRELGADVEYSDPHVPRTHKMRKHDLRMRSVPVTPERLAKADCVLIATDHDAFDWNTIARHSTLVVDTRNALRDHPDAGDRVVPA